MVALTTRAASLCAGPHCSFPFSGELAEETSHTHTHTRVCSVASSVFYFSAGAHAQRVLAAVGWLGLLQEWSRFRPTCARASAFAYRKEDSRARAA